MAKQQKTIFNHLRRPLHVGAVFGAAAVGFTAVDGIHGTIDDPKTEFSVEARASLDRDYQKMIDLNAEIRAASGEAQLEYAENGNTSKHRTALDRVERKKISLEKAKRWFVVRSFTNEHLSERDFTALAERAENDGFDLTADTGWVRTDSYGEKSPIYNSMKADQAEYIEQCRMRTADGNMPLKQSTTNFYHVSNCAQNSRDGRILSQFGGGALLGFLMLVALGDGRGRHIFETAPNKVYRRVRKPKPVSTN